MTPNVRPARDADIGEIRAIYDAVVTGTFISFENVTPSHDELAPGELVTAASLARGRVQGHLPGCAHAGRHHDRGS